MIDRRQFAILVAAMSVVATIGWCTAVIGLEVGGVLTEVGGALVVLAQVPFGILYVSNRLPIHTALLGTFVTSLSAFVIAAALAMLIETSSR